MPFNLGKILFSIFSTIFTSRNRLNNQSVHFSNSDDFYRSDSFIYGRFKVWRNVHDLHETTLFGAKTVYPNEVQKNNLIICLDYTTYTVYDIWYIIYRISYTTCDHYEEFIGHMLRLLFGKWTSFGSPGFAPHAGVRIVPLFGFCELDWKIKQNENLHFQAYLSKNTNLLFAHR